MKTESPQFRQNPLSGAWTIFAPKRAERPLEFAHSVLPSKRARKSPDCPFCLPNHPETLYTYPAEGPWQCRSVRNKYPALDENSDAQIHPTPLATWATAFGIHEVIIDSPRHDLTLGNFPIDAAKALLHTLRERFIQRAKDSRTRHIIIFKNHGAMAGSSLIHPHCQLIAVPIVTHHVQRRVDIATQYHAQHHRCLTCDHLADELRDGQRIISVGQHFVTLAPYASASSYQIWLIPRQHAADISALTDTALAELASAIPAAIRALETQLSFPDYNLLIRCAPSTAPAESVHWYITLVPRLAKMAGFEMGTGIFINPVFPEVAAAQLRQHYS